MRLSCSNNIFKYTTGLHRCKGFQKKYKRPTKVVKAETKGQRAKNVKSLDFLVALSLFDVNNTLISLFSSFKAMKAKKAAIVAGKAKLQMQKFVEPKILLQDPEKLF